MTALRLLGLGVLVAWALVLGVELWAYDSGKGVMLVRSSSMASPEEIRRNLEHEGGRVGMDPLSREPERAGEGLRADGDNFPAITGEWWSLGQGLGGRQSAYLSVTSTQDSSMAGEYDGDESANGNTGEQRPSDSLPIPPPAAEPTRTGSERSERSSDGHSDSAAWWSDIAGPRPVDAISVEALDGPGDVADGDAGPGDDSAVGDVGPVRRMRNVRFTFYTDLGITKWGCQAGPGIAATDPAVIPPMSRFRIVGWPGEWLACDTGSMVRGQHIDAWFPSLEAGRAFIRQMGESGEIEILRWGP